MSTNGYEEALREAGFQILDFLQVMGVPVPTWAWVSILLLGLIVAQFLVFHNIRIERDSIAYSLPMVDELDVRVHSNDKQVSLGVVNRGAKATFYASATATTEQGQTLEFRLPWQDEKEYRLDIPNQGFGFIPLLKLVRHYDGNGKEIFEIGLSEFARGNGVQYFTLLSWVGGEQMPHDAMLDVTLTADPEMFGGAICQLYYTGFRKLKGGGVGVVLSTAYEKATENLEAGA